MNGLFITFEGPDGSGKTTQIKLLSEYLKKKGRKVLTTVEPGGTSLGKKIRSILLDRENKDMSPGAETLLFQASRAELVSKVISPALASGITVICDRFFDSTIVYQGIARGLGMEKIIDMSLWATGGLVPDLTFLMQLEAGLGDERISNSLRERDRIEMEEKRFREDINKGYLKLAKKFRERIIPVDAGMKIEEIFNFIKEKVDSKMDEK
jgi:dTMP kinase